MPQSFSSGRLVVFGLLTVFFALGIYELMPSLTPATAEEMLDGAADETKDVAEIGYTGMPASNARVRPILVGHRNQFVVVCVAGCGGQAKPVQLLPKPGRKRAAQSMTTAESNDVLCLAGCDKQPGQVVQRIQELRKNSAQPSAPSMPKG